jgi:acetyl-CoA synthetase
MKINKNFLLYWELKSTIIQWYKKPKKIFYIPSLPKTRSGKILRRLLRDFVENPNNNEYSNLSTILDYSTIKKIKNIIKNEKF